MPIFPTPTVDYTDRDIDSLRLRLRALTRSVFPGWTDFSQAEPGNILLEGLSFVGDNLSFYMDALAREGFWPTLTRRLSAIRLGRLINYRLAGASPATGTARFSLPAPATVAITIPTGTRLRTRGGADPVRFRTTAAATIAIGASTADAAVEQAVAQSEGFASTEVPNLEVVLTATPFLDGSATVTANEGAFTEGTSFLGATSETRRFLVLVDDVGQARVRFGNGRAGRIPTGVITVAYRTGGGVGGNVDASTILEIEDVILDAVGGTPTLSVTNLQAASGGADRVSVEAARAQGPAALRAGEFSVTRDAFRTHAEAVSGVARASMVTSNEDTTVAENTGVLLVVAAGARLASGRIAPAAPSTTLLAAVRTAVTTTYPPTLTFQVAAQAAPFYDIAVSTRVYLQQGTIAATVAAAIRANLADLFAVRLADGTQNPEINFGADLPNAAGTTVAEIPWSTVFNVVRDTTGVRRVDEGPLGLLLNGLRATVVLGARNFPRLSAVTIEDVDTGSAL